MLEKSDGVGKCSGEVHEKYTAGRVNDLSYHYKRHSSTSSRDEQTTTRYSPRWIIMNQNASFRLIIAYILLITGLCGFCGVVSASGSAMFHYDAAHTGDYSPVAGSIVPNNQIKWSYPTGGQVRSSPAVVDGIVYFGSDDYNVYAINAATGVKIWNFTTGGNVQPSPAVANGMVYAGSWDGKLYALFANNGTETWNKSLGQNTPVFPTVANGIVYATVYNTGYIYAYNGTTGQYLWSTHVSWYTNSYPAVANNLVYIAAGDEHGDGWLIALNATTGVQAWSFVRAYTEIYSPSVANGIVYVGTSDPGITGGSVYALNATTGPAGGTYGGPPLWQFHVIEPVRTTPAIAYGKIYFGDDDGSVYAVNATTGQEVWNQSLGVTVLSSLAVANGVVYGMNVYGDVGAGNATTGTEIWNITTGVGGIFSAESSPAVVDGTVYIGSKDKKLYAIGTQSSIKPLPGFSNPPTDPDSDGLYEDLNANSRKDFNDVVVMFNQMQWIAANEPVIAFDFNGNGRIDFNDIVKLFGEI
jgi:outer membrane protein assembly factor BamB